MNHTPEIKKAIQFAAKKHHGQMRREKEPLPYITHLFSTALLVAEDTSDDELVIAALLHDTIEDTDTTEEEITRTFGARVAHIVATLSEPKEEAGRKLDWKETKKRYLAQLEFGSDEALLIALADKIDNIESKLEAYEREGPEFLKKFRDQQDLFWFHGVVLHMAEKRLPHHPLTKRLGQACNLEHAVFA